jgi:hypothetical protein
MKIRYLVALACLMATGARAEDMVVYRWDDVCNHTMTTNHFVLAAGQSSAKIYVDLSGCTDEQMGSLLFFGYHTTKNRSRQLSSKDKVNLYMSALDRYGNIAQQLDSASGAILADINGSSSSGCWLVAKNNSRNKEIKIRLRSQLISP